MTPQARPTPGPEPDHGASADPQVARIAALAEPIRRLLYRFVAERPDGVSRDQAAEGLGIPRHVAKFHLDKLADDGLLAVDYRRPAGRTGPGAGRPAKLYRPAQDEVAASVPERRYDLAADILARAVTQTQSTGLPIRDAIRAAARDTGAQWAAAPESADSAAAVRRLLAAHGYEPDTVLRDGEPERIVLRNCPFHRLAQAHTDLVCGINLDVLDGVLDARPDADLQAHLDPAPGRCCVTISRR